MIRKRFRLLSLLSVMLFSVAVSAQHKVEMIPFGNMDQWIDRQIKESGIIGGATKNVYAIGPTATIRENKPYKNMGGSPWATSNVMARVAGITKTNTSVFPEKRGDGFCARLDTRMESVKVLGIVDITVLAAGSIFLGDVHEPIKGTKNPQKILNSGIPFTKKPIAVQFDYKVKMSDREKRVHATGFSKITDVEGKDFPEMNLFLQKRWEDKDGNIYAKRVGTAVVRYYLLHYVRRYHGQSRIQSAHDAPAGTGTLCREQQGRERAYQRSGMGHGRRYPHPYPVAVYIQPRRGIHRFSGQLVLCG